MKKTAIVADTNSGLNARQAEELGIALLPMPFFVDGEACLEGQDYTTEAFFEKLRSGSEVSTSQPSLASLSELWEHLLETHDQVLHMPMSTALSSSCEMAQALARDYNGRVLVVDDHRISVTLLQSIRNAKAMLDQGKAAEEVQAILEEEKEASSIYVAVNTLEYLKKSGRVTAAGAAMASVLQIKPVLTIQGGKLDAFKKARGMSHAKKAMLAALQDDLTHRFAGEDMAVFAVYSGEPALGERWLEEVRAAFPQREVELASLPLSICCHVGDGALAVACARVRK
ncbi:MAG: DegV family protein [Evtepia sp.]|uniref:DegV family protein n=1 Tax=Evtepia sp. TaxID=2773933 RepID=UPI002A750FE4|nr:DegV family protein [Evtepia sp.]MDY3014674.1 DegV family protein [Evtepia sp.]